MNTELKNIFLLLLLVLSVCGFHKKTEMDVKKLKKEGKL
jgi:outer membrane lipopolysaccharide assembly protein LptE/RlpB